MNRPELYTRAGSLQRLTSACRTNDIRPTRRTRGIAAFTDRAVRDDGGGPEDLPAEYRRGGPAAGHTAGGAGRSDRIPAGGARPPARGRRGLDRRPADRTNRPRRPTVRGPQGGDRGGGPSHAQGGPRRSPGAGMARGKRLRGRGQRTPKAAAAHQQGTRTLEQRVASLLERSEAFRRAASNRLPARPDIHWTPRSIRIPTRPCRRSVPRWTRRSRSSTNSTD